MKESHHFIDVRLLALPKIEVHPLADKIGRVGRNLAEHGIPQHPLGNAGGVLGNHIDDLFPVVGVQHEQLGFQIRTQIPFGDLGMFLHEIRTHDHYAEVLVVTGGPIGDNLPHAFADFGSQPGKRRFPKRRRIKLARTEIRGNDFNGLVQVFGGLHVILLKKTAHILVRGAALGSGNDLPVKPAGQRFVVLEVRCVFAH